MALARLQRIEDLEVVEAEAVAHRHVKIPRYWAVLVRGTYRFLILKHIHSRIQVIQELKA